MDIKSVICAIQYMGSKLS